MPIMHVQTDSKVPISKSTIPVTDMDKGIHMVPVQRFKRESHSDKGHALSTALAVHYALGCTMYNR